MSIENKSNGSHHEGILYTETGERVKLSDEELKELINGLQEESGFDEGEDEDFKTRHESYSITLLEFAILNEYLFDCYRKPTKELSTINYGNTDNVGKIFYGGAYSMALPWWFQCKLDGEDNEFFIQTKLWLDNRTSLIPELAISCKNSMLSDNLEKLFKKVKALAFNHSKYVGKCIKVKLKDSNFKGVEIIDVSGENGNLILNDVQKRYIDHFISRLMRGGSARYLLNGEPGTGKTESIREIIRKLLNNVTFVIPDFTTSDDLIIILEACEIFERAVIIMDDIDLYLGSRDNGSYTQLLGQFLSFFDGVKKRKISLLASTNDKGLVDKAAERPGRFNMTLDYTFLDDEQIKKVCDIHLPEKYRIPEIYEVLTNKIDGRKTNITGAFIANLADNIKEMSEDDENWSVEDTIALIKESYKGFYMSQTSQNKSIGYITN